MSKETSEWLNTQCLVGFTDKRGKAWHYRESSQGVEPNHYAGAIPVEDVLRRLFAWHAVETSIFIPAHDGPWTGDPGSDFVEVPDRKAIVADDNRDVLGIFKSGYQPHQYDEWLLDNVASILNDSTGLGIAGAGLLRNRGQAFVQIELPENIETPEGFIFRPFLGATTSFDGTLATTYKKGATAWVCDNTVSYGLSEAGEVFKAKHSRNSGFRISDARAALGIVEQLADEITDAVSRLSAIDVTLHDWDAFLNELVPVPEDKGRSQTLALNKRDELQQLYRSDPRVSPWSGTALGVLQATNTWAHHFGTVRNASRAERNLSNTVFGVFAEDDDNTLKVLTKVRDRRLLTAV